MNPPFAIGMIVFKNFTALDLIGPHEVFSWFPNSKVLTLGATLDPVQSESGIRVLPDSTFESSPQLDLIFVPGGSGINSFITDKKALEFIKAQAKNAKYISSVCTGALALGASGLLQGYQATTHWASLEFLKEFGAIPTQERFVVDRNRLTGAGVTAGIDLALKIANEIYGPQVAQSIQLMLEYNPKPEFKKAGSPLTADSKIIEQVQKELVPLIQERKQAVSKAKTLLQLK